MSTRDDYSKRSGYDCYHARRYAELLALLRPQVGTYGRLLDIGPGTLTELIRQEFNGPVDTLGLGEEKSTPEGNWYHFDLNCAQEREGWRTDLPPYDVVVMAEVIEHLHTAPKLVLLFLRSLLKPNGLLLVQTPNAASLHKRIKLLFGRNPYEMIRENSSNPGHFREYTRSELVSIANEAGFALEAWQGHSYFDFRYRKHAQGVDQPSGWTMVVGTALNSVYRLMPPSLKPGQSMLLRAE